eukprot:8017351-Karenia_brevis.AAC.1
MMMMMTTMMMMKMMMMTMMRVMVFMMMVENASKAQRAPTRMLAIAQDPRIQPRDEDQEYMHQEHH